MSRRRWKRAPWRLFDVETTTPDPEGDTDASMAADPAKACIFQLAMRFRGGPIAKGGGPVSRVAFINPGVPIHPKIAQLCGLTPADLEAIDKAPPFSAVAEGIRRGLAHPDYISISYNGLTFDAPILDRHLVEAGQAPVFEGNADAPPHVDLRIPVEVFWRGSEHPLGTKAKGPRSLEMSGIRLEVISGREQTHRADDDCELLQRVGEKMTEAEPWRRPNRPTWDRPVLADAIGDYLAWQEAQGIRVQGEYRAWGPWLYRDHLTGAICVGAGAHIGCPLSHAEPGYLEGLANGWGLKFGMNEAARAVINAELAERAVTRRG